MSQNGPFPPGGSGPDPGAWQGGQGYPPPGGSSGPGGQGVPGTSGGPGAGWGGQPVPGQPAPGQPAPGQPAPGQPASGQPVPGQPAPQNWPSAGGQPGGWAQPPGQPQQPGGYGQYGPPPGQYGGQPPQQSWGAPPPPSNSPDRSKRLLFGLIGAAVVLALIAGVVWVVRNNGNSADPSPGVSTPPGPGQQSTQPQVPTPKASDAVAAYLRALGTGDATTAMSLAASAPTGDTTFLTNAVLAKATAGKVADVSITEVTDPNATSVAASYSLDGKPVSASFQVTRVGDQFRLAQIAAKVDISMLRRSTEVSLAGVQAKAAFVSLFPGVYPVTATNRNLSVGSVKITVGSLEAQTAGSAKLALSSAGKSAILKAAKTKYSWCLKQKTVRPSGCGFGIRVPSGVKLQTGTIRWTTRAGGKVSSAKPKLSSSAGWAEAKMKATVHFYARDARVSGRYWYKDIKLTGFQAKLSGSKITVTFY